MTNGNSIVNMSAAAAATVYCNFMVSTFRVGWKQRRNGRNVPCFIIGGSRLIARGGIDLLKVL